MVSYSRTINYSMPPKPGMPPTQSFNRDVFGGQLGQSRTLSLFAHHHPPNPYPPLQKRHPRHRWSARPGPSSTPCRQHREAECHPRRLWWSV
ncbi:hypothetical protein JTE90_029113 [Oedothorax gibbosus]|uniref:Uncharacterized protein n=1 Tax=Oedothorax gibbosus TaxID=931172 RepID=A0AAV6V6P8_9ARAC|nr:hypothetical protein JTE90_029113 [Oedothorax gibbosus]